VRSAEVKWMGERVLTAMGFEEKGFR
jgi:hypothetical protein